METGEQTVRANWVPMLRVVIGGHEYFARRLVRQLAAFDDRNSYALLNAEPGPRRRMARAMSVVRADVLYLIGGSVAGSRLVRFASAARTAVVMHWVGTDVVLAAQETRPRAAGKRHLARISHFCEVPWIQTELQQIGIEARVVPLAAMEGATAEPPSLPSTFSVLSYVREGRESFYGIDTLLRLARDFPAVEVRIAGISRWSGRVPGNVILLGWSERMEDHYADSVAFLRLPQHDGLSFSVLEALAAGRYVGYTYPLEGASLIASYAALCDFVGGLKTAFESGGLDLNRVGVEFVRRQYGARAVLGELVKRLDEARTR